MHFTRRAPTVDVSFPKNFCHLCLYVVVLLCITPIRDFGHHLLIQTDDK